MKQRLKLLKKKSALEKANKETKKILKEEGRIKKEIFAVSKLSRLIQGGKKGDERKDDSKNDSLDIKILTEDSFEEKEEGSISDNGYGRRGASGLSVYLRGITSSYTDYTKIWSWLGEFRTKGCYQFSEFEEKRLEETPLAIPSTPEILCDFEVIEKCIKHQKYFMPGDNMNGTYGNVPMAGVNSRDWEKFQLWAMVDYIMYKLFMDTM